MSVGLVLEGGAMRGLYTSGVLDVFLDNDIKVEDVFKQMEVLRATSAMPLVSKMVELGDKKYLDGGISDSIPIEKCKQLGYYKIIVVLTRPIDYRKNKSNSLLVKLKYKNYPNLVNTIINRYDNYNKTVEKIIDMEKRKEIFVIRPSKRIKIKRIEKNINILQQMYDLGIDDCKKCLPDLKKYLNIK